MTFTLPDLNYDYNALEPYIDAKTMEIHHSKHHAAYIAKLNSAIEGKNVSSSINELITNLDQKSELNTPAIRNNGGGHANHTFFWKILTPNTGSKPNTVLQSAIESTFGSLDTFKTEFSNAAATRFGSGWAWLIVEKGALKIESTPNQDSPLMQGKTPILGLDVWEHAYYLTYQNRRPDYINAFFNIVNWEIVSQQFEEAK